MGDFALAVYADSIPGYPRTSVPPEWRFRTRNWRVIFQRLNVTMQVPPFPIDPLPIPFGGVATGPLRVGGLVMLRVDAPVDAPAVTLRFVPHDATVWPGTRAPQVSIFRLP